MYIKRVKINNVRSLAELEWNIAPDQAAGWHVIIGDNGAGKSAFVGSISLALIGQDYTALSMNWNTWLRRGEPKGHIRLELIVDRDYDQPPQPLATLPRFDFERTTFAPDLVNTKVSVPRHLIETGNIVHPANERGWFSAAYGPFRRFVGSDPNDDELYSSRPRLARHLSVFSERFALTETLRWLQDLQYKKYEKNDQGEFLDAVKEFINQEGFLPNRTRLTTVTSDGVEFVDGNGSGVRVEELSDGYRSILSITLELIRQLARCYGAERVFEASDYSMVAVPGVVLIDEVDAHLHPTWQRKIGPCFRRLFPKMQFIVTTHSPLVCQAADHGTVFKLPIPGMQETGRMLTGIELDRLLYGNVLEAYSTEAFGNGITRSEAAQEKLQRLAALNRKELHAGLSNIEEAEQTRLRAMFPTTPNRLERETAK